MSNHPLNTNVDVGLSSPSLGQTSSYPETRRELKGAVAKRTRLAFRCSSVIRSIPSLTTQTSTPLPSSTSASLPHPVGSPRPSNGPPRPNSHCSSAIGNDDGAPGTSLPCAGSAPAQRRHRHPCSRLASSGARAGWAIGPTLGGWRAWVWSRGRNRIRLRRRWGCRLGGCSRR